jgi:hypothetical protein
VLNDEFRNPAAWRRGFTEFKLRNLMNFVRSPVGPPRNSVIQNLLRLGQGTSLSPYFLACIIYVDGSQIAIYTTIIAQNSCFKPLHTTSM